ncbi:MAG: rod shape-determining protein, partial [Oscillospiraceae bacterium]|nr:rod shape-determining protein [Oscillospiraceae bacterium]
AQSDYYQSVKGGGNAFNDALVRFVRKKFNTLIGDSTAEELKKTIGSVFPRQENATMEVKGRDLATGLPKVVAVSMSDTTEAFSECLERILEALRLTLERTPPELVADISHNGIVLTGGGSLIWGLDRLLQKATGIPTRIADDAEQCVAFGISKALETIETMHEGTINISRRMQMKF